MEHSFTNIKCFVKDCENRLSEGKFVGGMCEPCFNYVSLGEGKFSQAYRNSLKIVDDSRLAAVIKKACELSTFSAALDHIIIWESERAIAEALKWKETGIRTGADGGAWSTCFGFCIRELAEAWDKKFGTSFKTSFNYNRFKAHEE